MIIDKSKLTFIGSMNYVVQVGRYIDEDSGELLYYGDNYMPRKNRIYTFEGGELEESEVKRNVSETIERMKIAINQFQEFLDGKRDMVYYWEE